LEVLSCRLSGEKREKGSNSAGRTCPPPPTPVHDPRTFRRPREKRSSPPSEKEEKGSSPPKKKNFPFSSPRGERPQGKGRKEFPYFLHHLRAPLTPFFSPVRTRRTTSCTTNCLPCWRPSHFHGPPHPGPLFARTRTCACARSADLLHPPFPFHKLSWQARRLPLYRCPGPPLPFSSPTNPLLPVKAATSP